MIWETLVPPGYSLCSPSPGDGCASQGAQADPASGKRFLDCTGVFKTKKKLAFSTFKCSDDENGMWTLSAHSLTHYKLYNDTHHMMCLYTCAHCVCTKILCTHLQPLLQHTHPHTYAHTHIPMPTPTHIQTILFMWRLRAGSVEQVLINAFFF